MNIYSLSILHHKGLHSKLIKTVLVLLLKCIYYIKNNKIIIYYKVWIITCVTIQHILFQDETELRPFFCHYSPFTSFFSPLRKKRLRIKKRKGSNGDQKNAQSSDSSFFRTLLNIHYLITRLFFLNIHH